MDCVLGFYLVLVQGMASVIIITDMTEIERFFRCAQNSVDYIPASDLCVCNIYL